MEPPERGAAVVEMMVIVPVVVVLLGVVVNAARLVQTATALTATARDAARAAAAAPDLQAAEREAIKRAREVAGSLGLAPGRLAITQQTGKGFARGAPYEVSVRYALRMLPMPFADGLPPAWELSASHTELIERYGSR